MKIKLILFACLILLPIQPSMSADIAPSDSGLALYYEIGGGQAVSIAATNDVHNFELGGSISWGFNASCGNFDFNFSIASFMNNIKNSADAAIQNMVAAATGFISNLPALILQRANPGLYDLLQNGILRAEEMFNISIKSCEEMEQDFVGGKNPFEGFAMVSKRAFWNKEKESGGDVISAKKSADERGKNSGFPWVGGRYGAGSGSDAVEVNKDVSGAGYNLLLGRSPDDDSSATNGRITEVFANPGEIQDFATDVLGDVVIKTCDGCEMVRASAGKGLLPVLSQETETIQTELAAMVASTDVPSYDDLDNVSASGLRITAKIIESLREETDPEQSLLIAKLSNDIALARTLEKALLLRRALESGKREPNVSANAEALDIVKTSVEELNSEIENLLFELEIRDRISNSTVKMVLARQFQREHNITGSQRPTYRENRVIDATVKP